MRLKKFKNFINEEVLNKELVNNTWEEEMTAVQKQLNEIEDLELRNLNIEDWNDLIFAVESATPEQLPITLKKMILLSLKLMMHEDFRKDYKTFLNYYKSKLEQCKSKNKTDLLIIKDDPMLIQYSKKIEKKMYDILRLPKDELDELTSKYFGSIKKYKSSLEDSKRVTQEDPFGEETWDDLSDEERLRNSFEN
jgi:predicted ribosome-associated RNA-binding protein Tma20